MTTKKQPRKQHNSEENNDQAQANNASQEANTAQPVPANYFGNMAARRPAKRPTGSNDMLLQWFNGLSAGRQLAVGWHIQSSRCSEELTAALAALHVPRLTVIHKMSGELVEYFSISTCSLIIVCDGFGDIWEMRHSQERTGIAYGWNQEKGRSKMKCKVFIAELASLDEPYLELFTIPMEGYIIESFLQAVEMQFQVLDAYEQLTGNTAPFCGFSLTIGPAENPRQVGKGIKKNTIIPTVALLPEEIDSAYLSTHLCPPLLLKKIINENLIDKAIQWSIDASQRISTGEDREHYEDQSEARTAHAAIDLSHEAIPETTQAERIKKLGAFKAQLRELLLVTDKTEWAALKNRLDLTSDDASITEQELGRIQTYINTNSKLQRRRKP